MDTNPPVPPLEQPTQKSPNIDRAIGVLFGLGGILLFVLQENGVEINWVVSLCLYLLIAAGCVFSVLRHAIPHLSKWLRYVIAAVVVLLVGGLGSYGTVKQYRHDHPETASAGAGATAPAGNAPSGPVQQPPSVVALLKPGGIRPPAQPRADDPVPRHTLSGEEQKRFEAPLRVTSPKLTIILNCPQNEEQDCAYALQFVDYFRTAGFTVDGNMVHRITLKDPFSGVVLGAHVDKDADPNRPVGTGIWVALSETSMNVTKAFANIHTGTVQVSGSQVPSDSLEVYFGPERPFQDEKTILQQSIVNAQKYDQAQKYMAEVKKAKEEGKPIPKPPQSPQ
jgi:hypothetical protein